MMVSLQKKKKKQVKGCTENANSSEQAANEDCASALRKAAQIWKML